MLKDWNFWCTVMTSIAAFIALYLSVRQIKLGNKQQLFDRRLKVYMLVNSIISLCKENYTLEGADKILDYYRASKGAFLCIQKNKRILHYGYIIKQSL